MSATLRAADFTANTRLFPAPPPLLSIPARQHPVVSHYARRTEQRHWLQAVLVRVLQMHVKLPEGGILVFVSGRDEIDWLCRKVEEEWKGREDRARREEVKLMNEVDEEEAARAKTDKNGGEERKETEEEEEAELYQLDDEADDMAGDGDEADENDGEHDKDASKDGEVSKQGANEEMEANLNKLFSSRSTASSACSTTRPTLFPHCLPLYSLLPSHLQLRVFQPPPTTQHRTIIFATNIAETSITIPHIRYVLDSGRTKRREFDPLTGCERFTVGWISRASAQQREGRAGRTAAGHCYRMYSAAVYGRLVEQDEAEILREPVDSVVLMMKAIGVRDVRHFPFISPPPDANLRQAELLLQRLGAVEKGGAVSELGRVLSLLPVSPRYGRMIALGHQGGCLGYVIAIVAALTVQQLFTRVRMREEMEREENEEAEEESDETERLGDDHARQREQRQQRRRQLHERLTKATQRWQHKDSDLLTYLRVIGGYEYARQDDGSGSKEEQRERRQQKAQRFCDDNFVRLKAMEEIQQLRAQLTQITQRMLHGRKGKGAVTGGAEEVRGDDVEEDEANDQPTETVSASTSAVASILSSPLSPPTPHQERLLRHLLLSGMIDQVARRMSEQDKQALLASTVVEPDTNLAGAYSILSSSQPAFIHPSSVLFPSAAQPVYLVYQSLVESERGGGVDAAEGAGGGGKRYLRDCTVIEEDVMVSVGEAAGLVTWSAWLDDPPPTYNKQTERVEAFKRGTFGPHRWPIHPTRKPLAATAADDTKGREYREFVRLLLQGDVYEQLRPFGPFYVCRPSHLCGGSGSAVKSGLLELVRVCARDGVRSRVELRARCKTDASYLCREMLAWLQPSQHQQLTSMWPPQQ